MVVHFGSNASNKDLKAARVIAPSLLVGPFSKLSAIKFQAIQIVAWHIVAVVEQRDWLVPDCICMLPNDRKFMSMLNCPATFPSQPTDDQIKSIFLLDEIIIFFRLLLLIEREIGWHDAIGNLK